MTFSFLKVRFLKKIITFLMLLFLYNNVLGNVSVDGINIRVETWSKTTCSYIGSSNGYEIFSINIPVTNGGFCIKNITKCRNFVVF